MSSLTPVTNIGQSPQLESAKKPLEIQIDAVDIVGIQRERVDASTKKVILSLNKEQDRTSSTRVTKEMNKKIQEIYNQSLLDIMLSIISRPGSKDHYLEHSAISHTNMWIVALAKSLGELSTGETIKLRIQRLVTRIHLTAGNRDESDYRLKPIAFLIYESWWNLATSLRMGLTDVALPTKIGDITPEDKRDIRFFEDPDHYDRVRNLIFTNAMKCLEYNIEELISSSGDFTQRHFDLKTSLSSLNVFGHEGGFAKFEEVIGKRLLDLQKTNSIKRAVSSLFNKKSTPFYETIKPVDFIEDSSQIHLSANLGDYANSPGYNRAIKLMAGVVDHESTEIRLFEKIGDAGAYCLSILLQNTKNSVTAVSFADNGFSQSGIHYLGHALKKTKIRKFSCRFNGIADSNIQVFSAALQNDSKLISLDLSRNQIREKGGSILAMGLSKNATLEELDLSMNLLRDAGISSIVEAVRSHPTLTTLFLEQTSFGCLGAEKLGVTLQSPNCHLEDLDVSSNFIRTKGAIAIGTAISRNNSLIKINLSQNPLFDGVIDIADGLRFNKTLIKLNLSSTYATQGGVRRLASALIKNTTLEVLGLAANQLTDANAADIAGLLKSICHLKVIALNANNFTDKGIEMLFQALEENNTLEEIDVSYNMLGIGSLISLSRLIAKNKTLSKVSIRYDLKSTEGLIDVLEALKQRSEKIVLEFENPVFLPTPVQEVLREIEDIMRINRGDDAISVAQLSDSTPATTDVIVSSDGITSAELKDENTAPPVFLPTPVQEVLREIEDIMRINRGDDAISVAQLSDSTPATTDVIVSSDGITSVELKDENTAPIEVQIIFDEDDVTPHPTLITASDHFDPVASS